MNIYQDSTNLLITKLSFNYDSAPLFTDFSVSFPKGKLSAILGPSGCGKSTLFKLISGITQVPQATASNQLAPHIAFMQQDDLLLPWLSAYDNIMLPFTLQPQLDRHAHQTVIEGLIDTLNLRSFMQRFPHELSGGLRKRMALLRTYAMNREIILLDEAFASLDFFTRSQLYQWLQLLQEQLPKTIILITHDFDEALLLAEHIFLLGTPPHQQVTNLQHLAPYPRSQETLLLPAVLQIKQELIAFFATSLNQTN